MTKSVYRVDTTSRLVQWSIDNFAFSDRSHKPVYLEMGNLKWRFILEKYERRGVMIPFFWEPTSSLFIKHYPKLPGDTPLIASFNIRVVSLSGGRKTLLHKKIRDKQLKTHEDFVCGIDLPLTGRVIVQVEFLDLKTVSPNVGESPCSIWSTRDFLPHKDLNATASSHLGKMLSENIYTDITIRASDGANIGAHRAVLAARSPVFHRMFSHGFKEKEMSAINISDMSIEACQAFVSYMYSNIRYEDFLIHRLELLRGADKYDVSDLKDACEESLLEDIDTKNVFERLQNAYLYGAKKLKVCCIEYLVKFGMMFEIREEFNEFIESGDREVIGEVIKEVISCWEGF